jgi:hypothetical protein
VRDRSVGVSRTDYRPANGVPGLTVEETADVLSVSPETVMRDWKTAKAWLLREFRAG